MCGNVAEQARQVLFHIPAQMTPEVMDGPGHCGIAVDDDVALGHRSRDRPRARHDAIWHGAVRHRPKSVHSRVDGAALPVVSGAATLPVPNDIVGALGLLLCTSAMGIGAALVFPATLAILEARRAESGPELPGEHFLTGWHTLLTLAVGAGLTVNRAVEAVGQEQLEQHEGILRQRLLVQRAHGNQRQ